jgi:hypothetical protein
MGDPRPDPCRDKNLELTVRSFATTATMLLVLLGLSTTVQALHPAVGRLSGAGQATFVELWPQQWQFFSNFADRDVIAAYSSDADGSKSVPVTMLHASTADLWGLRYAADSLTLDLLYLANSVPADAWTSCGALGERACLNRAVTERPIPIADRYSASLMCGVHILAIEGAEEFTGNSEPNRPILETVRISVTCLAN